MGAKAKVWRVQVHNGATTALMQREAPRLPCSELCKDGVHGDVVYQVEGVNRASLLESLNAWSVPFAVAKPQLVMAELIPIEGAPPRPAWYLGPSDAKRAMLLIWTLV